MTSSILRLAVRAGASLALLVAAIVSPAQANVTCGPQLMLAGDAETLTAAVGCFTGLDYQGDVNIELTADIELPAGLDVSNTSSEFFVISIDGAGHTVSAPSDSESVFESNNGQANFSDITLSGATHGLFAKDSAIIIGDRMTLTANDNGATAASNVADGSLIWLRHSLIRGNFQAGMLAENGTVRLNNSTVSENTVGANIQLGGRLYIGSSTIANNDLHGLFFDAQNPLNSANIGEVYLFSSIVGLNDAEEFGFGEDCHLNINADQVPVYFPGAPASSFDSDGSCMQFAEDSANTPYVDEGLSPVSISSADLESLMDNGCEPAPDCEVRQTHALTRHSVARESGTCVDDFFAFMDTAVTDQRGYARGPVCDSGAHEYNGCDADPIRVALLNTWHMLSLPCIAPEGSTMQDLVDAAMTTWSAFVFENGRYAPLFEHSPVPPPGTGFWFISSEPLKLEMPQDSTGTVLNESDCLTEGVCVAQSLAASRDWNLAGNQLASPIHYSQMSVHNAASGCDAASGCALIDAQSNGVAPSLWQWQRYREAYVAFNDIAGSKVAMPWEGFWARFDGGAQSVSSEPWRLFSRPYPVPLPTMMDIPLTESKCFPIGSPANEPGHMAEEFQREVCFDAAYGLGKYEVTFAQYDAYANAVDGVTQPSDTFGWGRGDRPVINVNWSHATAYAEWLSEITGRQYTLPTEAQWEYGARGGTTTAFHTGDDITAAQANLGHTQTLVVGTFEPNAFGLHNVHGNVLEWTCSAYAFLYGDSATECADSAAGGLRSVRGGSYATGEKLFARSAHRADFVTTTGRTDLGFRLSVQ